MLPLQGPQIASLVRELRSCKPHGMAKKKQPEKLVTKLFRRFGEIHDNHDNAWDILVLEKLK